MLQALTSDWSGNFRILLWLLWDRSRICQSIGGFGQKHVLMMNLLEGYSLGTHRIIEAAALWYCCCNSRSFQEITNSSIRHFSYMLDILFCFVPVLHFVGAECANSFLGCGALYRWVHCIHDYIYLWILFEQRSWKVILAEEGDKEHTLHRKCTEFRFLPFPLNISTFISFLCNPRLPILHSGRMLGILRQSCSFKTNRLTGPFEFQWAL